MPGRSRKDPTSALGLLWTPLMKKYFSAIYCHLRENVTNTMSTKCLKIVSETLMKTVRKIPERPHDDPMTIVRSSGEKHFSTKFHHFGAKYFSSFRNFPPLAKIILNTSRGICYVVPKKNCVIFPWKIIGAEINLPLSKNRHIKIEKLRLFWN